MSNYTKTTDFEAKDSLPTGDSGKIIRGAEFETEFDAIATAITTKADTAGPTFTGTLTFETISDGTIGVTAFVDEDDMSSDSATLVPTQQSVKAYVDSVTTELQAQDLDFQADSGGALNIDLDTETMTFTGGTGIDTSGSGNAVTFDIDSTVTTLTGTQTLTNKTLTTPTISGNLTTDGTIDGRDVATDGAKLDGIEAGATADQTAAEIRTLVESATDSNVFTDADHSKLDGIEAGATADQTDAEIRAAVEAATDSNVFTDADHTKLDGIEASADVTDTANVTAAGALMDSEVTNLAQVKAFDSSDYATAAQGTTADSAMQDLVDDTTPQLGGDLASNGNDILFADNDKAIFGAGSDLQIYHDGSNSYIDDAGTGALQIRSNGLYLQKYTNENMIRALADGAVSLYYDNAIKLDTTSTGIDVTGSVVSDGLTVNDAGTIQLTKNTTSAGDSLGIIEFHDEDGSASADAGKFQLQAFRGADKDSPEFKLIGSNSSGVLESLLVVNSTGIQVTGDISNASGDLTLDVAGYINLDADGGDVALKDGGTEFGRIKKGGNNLEIQSRIYDGDIVLKGFDNTSIITALALDMSAAGAATFNAGASFGGTVTADGLTVNNVSTNPVTFLRTTSSSEQLELSVDDSGVIFNSYQDESGRYGGFTFQGTENGVGTRTRLRIFESTGDIAFYEDTGTTAKLVWSASEESLRVPLSLYNNSINAFPSTGYASIYSTGAGGTAPFNEAGHLVLQARSSGALRDIIFATGNGATERMRIDSSGNLLVGTTTVNGTGITLGAGDYGYFSRSGDAALFVNRSTSDGDIIELRKADTKVGSIGSEAGGFLSIGNADTGLSFLGSIDAIGPYSPSAVDGRDAAIDLGTSTRRFKDLYLSGGVRGTSTIDITVPETSGGAINLEFGNNVNTTRRTVQAYKDNFQPAAADDGVIGLGQASNRWDDVYATNGTIQTSDRNEKQDIEALSDAEQRVAVAAKGLLRKFRWINSVADKGDDARIHFGIIAQDLQDAFTAEGLDAGRYAMFISTTWTDEETGEERTRMGVRYSELLAFIISAI